MSHNISLKQLSYKIKSQCLVCKCSVLINKSNEKDVKLLIKINN